MPQLTEKEALLVHLSSWFLFSWYSWKVWCKNLQLETYLQKVILRLANEIVCTQQCGEESCSSPPTDVGFIPGWC